MLAAMVEILDRIPEYLRRTLTHDRGVEMARCPWPIFSPRFWPPEVPAPRCDFQL
jgi:hypothetical protein